ncbi:MAG: GvpL/GvpF family gas vesicle protein [Thermoanaerobaculia bacterium]
MAEILYLYAIAARGELTAPPAAGVDGRGRFAIVEQGRLAALAGRVDSNEFSQESIDARASDLDWIGAIGWRHQEVVNAVRETTDVVPVRAFTLFSSETTLRDHLREREAALVEVLDRIRGRDEWTLQVEFDGDRWPAAVERRSPALAQLRAEAESAPEGRAYLLRKKIEDARRSAGREEEDRIVAELEERAREEFASPLVVERRQTRAGAFPQINILLDRSAADRVREFAGGLSRAWESDGVTIRLTGPWPPYTFVGSEP